jgi:hypothetical protein
MKTKLTIALFLLLLAELPVSSFSQEYYYYSLEGERVPLMLNDSVICIKPLDGAELDAIVASEPALQTGVTPTERSDGFYLLRVNPDTSLDSLIPRLAQLPEVDLVNRCFFGQSGNPIYLSSRFLCRLNPAASGAAVEAMNATHSVKVVHTFFMDPNIVIMQVSRESDLDVLTLANLYVESGLASYAKAGMSSRMHLAWQPNDPYWQYQWYLNNPSYRRYDIELDKAFDYTLPPNDVIVAIPDDGFDSHEDIDSLRIIACNDYYWPDFSCLPPSDWAHGMGCLGIIAAGDSNGIGVTGIASRHVRIIGQKISDVAGGHEVFASDGMLAVAVDDAVEAGAKVINCSWGCYDRTGGNCGFTNLQLALELADSAGVSIVAATGNDGAFHANYIDWPAKMPEVIAVGATKGDDSYWGYSEYGEQLDVMAPSGDVESQTVELWTLDQMANLGYNPDYVTCSPQNTNYMCAFGGTSASCAEVSGIIALLRARRPSPCSSH